MQLSDLIKDADVLCALEPDELGLRMLPAFVDWDQTYRSTPLTLDTFLTMVCGDGRGYPGQYGHEHAARVRLAGSEAWAWLEGQALLFKHPGYVEPNHVRMLSRRGSQLAREPNPRRVLSARRIPKESLHPTIREDVWSLYHRGKYDTAIFEAMKAVEVAVRTAAGLAAWRPQISAKTLCAKPSMLRAARLLTTKPSQRKSKRAVIFLPVPSAPTKIHTHIAKSASMIPTKPPRSSCWGTTSCELSTRGVQRGPTHES